MVEGSISAKTPHSRIRRAISCEYWPPKSRTSTSSVAGTSSGAGGPTPAARSSVISGDVVAARRLQTARRRLRSRVSHRSSATPAETAARPFEPMPTDCSVWSFLPSLCSAGATITSARWKERMSS